MKQEDKDLLLRDLCARLPYGVKVHAKYIDTDTDTEVKKIGVLSMVDNDKVIAFTCDDINCYNYVAIHEVKPYLFPLSSMTEEQKKFLRQQNWCIAISTSGTIETTIEGFDWLLKNHFDIYGLIPKGLATDATGLNIY